MREANILLTAKRSFQMKGFVFCTLLQVPGEMKDTFKTLKKLNLTYNACFRSTTVKPKKTHISSWTNKTFNAKKRRVKRNRQTWSKVVVGFTLTVCRRALGQRTTTLLQTAILNLWWSQRFSPLRTSLPRLRNFRGKQAALIFRNIESFGRNVRFSSPQ